MDDLTRIAALLGIVTGAVSLVVAVIVVLSTGKTKSTTLKTLETGNTELRAQNADQEKRLAESETKIVRLEADVARMTEQLTQRAAVNELAMNLSDIRTEFTRRFELAAETAQRREAEAVDRHKLEIQALENLLKRIDEIPSGRRRRAA